MWGMSPAGKRQAKNAPGGADRPVAPTSAESVCFKLCGFSAGERYNLGLRLPWA